MTGEYRYKIPSAPSDDTELLFKLDDTVTLYCLFAIAERLEAQVEAIDRLTEAVKGLKAGPDCGPVTITMPMSTGYSGPLNPDYGPCGGE